MGLIDHLNRTEMQEMRQLVESIVRSAPAGFTSISRGSLRILSPEGFFVGQAASAMIDGLLKVLGTLEVTGTFTLSGIGRVAGSFTITGPFTVEGKTSMTGNFTSTGEFTLNGPFHINGATDLNGTLTVHPSGKITIEGPSPITLENGRVTVSGPIPLVLENGALTVGGGELSGVGAGITMKSGDAGIETLLGLVRLFAGGETATLGNDGSFDVSGDLAARQDLSVAKSLRVGEQIQTSFLPTKVGVSANAHIDPATGMWYRVI
jgi:cytoskeletal protein CcmA (bactofilin family)